MEKRCTKCNITKKLDEFHKKKNSKDGKNCHCKICKKEIDKIYRNNNKEKIKETNKLYRNNNINKEEAKEYSKKYREINKEKIKEYEKIYYEENKEEIYEKKKIYYEANKDEIKEKTKEYYENNKDELNEKKKLYYENNKECKLQQAKEYRDTHKEQIKVYKKNYIRKKCLHNKRKDQCIDCFPRLACQLCFNHNISNSTYKPHCVSCYYKLNPHLACAKRYKVKERQFMDDIKKTFPNHGFIYDNSIKSECSSKKRPDIRLELYTHTIILECDEFQHKYNTYELKRMEELYEDLAQRPIIFLRFNPDSYINEDDIKVDSCFSKDNKINQTEWEMRIKLLNERIQFHIDNIPEPKLKFNKDNDYVDNDEAYIDSIPRMNVEYLFYDL